MANQDDQNELDSQERYANGANYSEDDLYRQRAQPGFATDGGKSLQGYYNPHTGTVDDYPTYDSTPLNRPGIDRRLQKNLADPYAGMVGDRLGVAESEEGRLQGLADAAQNGKAAQIDNTLYNQDRANEMAARGMQSAGLDAYRGVIQGQGPSTAAVQQRQGFDAAAQGAAASFGGRGGGVGLAASQRQAMQGQAGAMGQANAQAATARLGEITSAMSGYSALAQNQRAADLQRQGLSADQAYQQAELEAKQRDLNAQTALKYEGLKQSMYGMQQQGSEYNESQNYNAYRQGTEVGQQQSEQRAQTNGQVVQGAAAVGGTVLSLLDQKSGGNTDQQLPWQEQGKQYAPRQYQSGATQSGQGITSDMRAKQDIAPGAAQAEAQLDAMHGVAPAMTWQDAARQALAQHVIGGPAGDLARTYMLTKQREAPPPMRMRTRAPVAARAAHEEMPQRAQAPARDASALTPEEWKAYVFAQNARTAGNATPADQAYVQRVQQAMPLAQGVPAAGQTLMSDERTKEGIHASGVEQALDHLKPYSYSYKDPSMGEGRRVGVMAQDLEKSPVGLSTVIETPRGKAIDVNRGLSLALASSADLHARVKALEAGRKR